MACSERDERDAIEIRRWSNGVQAWPGLRWTGLDTGAGEQLGPSVGKCGEVWTQEETLTQRALSLYLHDPSASQQLAQQQEQHAVVRAQHREGKLGGVPCHRVARVAVP